MTRRLLLIAATITLLAPAPARACTTFAMGAGERLLVGKSYDWDTPHGLVLLNRRGLKKQALVLAAGVKPASWTARYGSLTFNQYGREMPNGGINEAGLVVEIMWLSSTRHPALAPDRPTVNELQWIQYLLDTSGTLKEALAAARKLQVARIHGQVHYMVCDRAGACGTFEYLAGKLVVHHGKRLPARVLTNSTYKRSAAALRRHRGGKVPGGSGSLARFVRAASLANKAGKAPTVKQAFAALESVAQGEYTRWQIVYESAAGKVHFRVPGREARTVNVKALDFACSAPVKVMDLHGSVLGLGPKMVPYQRAHNEELVKKSFANLGLKLPAIILKQLAWYPEAATSCAR